MNTNTSFELLVKAYKALVAQSEAASHRESLHAVALGETAIEEVETYFESLKPTDLTKVYACSNKGERMQTEEGLIVFKPCQYTLTPLGLNDMRCVGCKFKRTA